MRKSNETWPAESEKSPGTLDVIAVDDCQTLYELFRRRCERTPHAVAYRAFDHAGNAWCDYSWLDMAQRVSRWCAAMATAGLVAGDRVAVALANGIEWVCFDLAAQRLGLIVVALYTTDNAGNIAYILGDCGARLLLLRDQAAWRALAPHSNRFPALELVIAVNLDDVPRSDSGVRLIALDAWLPAAQDAAPAPSAVAGSGQPGSDAVATIVYTSGTTGRPKGVMLSHRNILWNVASVLEYVPGYREDVFLSFLPLSHAFERTVGYYLPIMTGSTVAYARSVEQLAEDLVSIAPTLLVSVPRIYERVYARVHERLASKGPIARTLFQHATAIGWRRFEAMQRGSALRWTDRLQWPVMRALVARPLLARLGGRLRIAFCGGAPLQPEVARCFIGLGLPVIQGYGLTEAAPIVSANLMSDNDPESVGRPIPGVDVRVGANDELLVRSPGVMQGYWQRADDTAAAVDPDGWLHTGDQVRIDSGRIYITGRTKEIIVLSTGEKVPPADVEAALRRDPLVEQALLVGEGKSSLGALLVLNPSAWSLLARTLGLEANDPASLHGERAVTALLSVCARQTGEFPVYAHVRHAWLTLEPWTIDNGLLTPTLKIKRASVHDRCAQGILAMYAEQGTDVRPESELDATPQSTRAAQH